MRITRIPFFIHSTFTLLFTFRGALGGRPRRGYHPALTAGFLLACMLTHTLAEPCGRRRVRPLLHSGPFTGTLFRFQISNTTITKIATTTLRLIRIFTANKKALY